MRYRLVPARGTRNITTHFFAESDEEAEYLAQREVQAGRRVLLCRAPIDGIVREVCLVGADPQTGAKRR